MPDTVANLFLTFSKDRLRTFTSRIVDCLGRLSDEQIWARGGENENSIGNLVLHLCGNVQQWIVSGVGGKADIRDRDSEFAALGGVNAGELQHRLEATIREAIEVIASVPAARLPEIITVQSYQRAVLEVIYTAVEHFAQHTGQIIFATKILSGQDLGYYKHLNRPAGAR
ncbi:MAG: DUF1572 family protein [Candidatus Acidiferrales bacterium]|jgi:uncharacterized damage-inducible protein DinB